MADRAVLLSVLLYIKQIILSLENLVLTVRSIPKSKDCTERFLCKPVTFFFFFFGHLRDSFSLESSRKGTVPSLPTKTTARQTARAARLMKRGSRGLRGSKSMFPAFRLLTECAWP